MRKIHNIILSTENFYNDFNKCVQRLINRFLEGFLYLVFFAFIALSYWVAILGIPLSEGLDGDELIYALKMEMVFRIGATVVSFISTFYGIMMLWEWSIHLSKIKKYKKY